MGAPKQLPEIDEEQVRALAAPKSFERGYEYLQAGAVQRVVLRGNFLFAEVAGSEYDPYRVTVELSKKRIAEANCTCPYEFGGICKHIVATLLAYIQTPEEIEHRQPIEELIAPLSPEQLRELILVLVQEQPQLLDVIDDELRPGS
ncbi:MAG: SWIM zinc finger family protein [Chloroflexota bacterium]|nr:SWIM zinc finger family protein [Chloroflexota bacterium]